MTTRIMVVDDELAIGTLLLYQLQSLGYEAVYVQDGMQALQRVLLEQPDLILLDVMMPQLNGWEVCREIRSCSDVPIIMLTGKDANDDVVAGLSAGADDYVTKPFVMSQLQARVEAVLRRSRTAGNHSPARRSDYGVIAPVHSEPIRPVFVVEQPRPVRPIATQVALATPAGTLNTTLVGHSPVAAPSGTASMPAGSEIEEQSRAESRAAVKPRLGSRLRLARQERNISLYQAERLCQSRWDILQAIEQENWDYAPRQQMRSALISYANLLKVNLQPYQKQRSSWASSVLEHQQVIMILLAVALIIAIGIIVL